ncbi:AraC family transcriptional regulator, partial [Streptococcus agalactiae]
MYLRVIYKNKRSVSIMLCKHTGKAGIVNQIGFQVCL